MWGFSTAGVARHRCQDCSIVLGRDNFFLWRSFCCLVRGAEISRRQLEIPLVMAMMQSNFLFESQEKEFQRKMTDGKRAFFPGVYFRPTMIVRCPWQREMRCYESVETVSKREHYSTTCSLQRLNARNITFDYLQLTAGENISFFIDLLRCSVNYSLFNEDLSVLTMPSIARLHIIICKSLLFST